MNKIKEFFNYIFSVFNPMWRDTGLHFFIKSILAVVLWIISSMLVIWSIWLFTTILGIVSVTGTIFTMIIVNIVFMFWLQLSVAARRFRDLWTSQWALIIYLLSMFTWVIWIIYWLYLCFTKGTKKVEEKVEEQMKEELNKEL